MSDSAGCEILLVEDDQDIRDSLVLILSQEGYSVTPAATGVEALVRLEDGCHPRLILLDLMMPEMDGAELLKVLGGRAEHSATPVVVITASTTAQPPRGAAAILRKPLLLEQLLDVVEQFKRKADRA